MAIITAQILRIVTSPPAWVSVSSPLIEMLTSQAIPNVQSLQSLAQYKCRKKEVLLFNLKVTHCLKSVLLVLLMLLPT